MWYSVSFTAETTVAIQLPSVDSSRLQKPTQHPGGLAPSAGADELLGRTLGDEAVAGVATVGAEVDDPIRLGFRGRISISGDSLLNLDVAHFGESGIDEIGEVYFVLSDFGDCRVG